MLHHGHNASAAAPPAYSTQTGGTLLLPTTTSVSLPTAPGVASSLGRPPSAPLSDSLLLTLRQRPHARLFRALFQYLPLRDSPNENPNLELALNPGDMILVRGEMDDDGFYRGETLDGRTGLVPSNYVERVPDVWLLQNASRAPSPSFPLSIPPHHTQIIHDFSDPSYEAAPSSAPDFLGSFRDCSGGVVPESVCPYPPIDVSRVTVQEIKQNELPRVPCPREIVIEKKLSRSIVVAWSPPEESFIAISQYHVCVDGQVRAVVPGSYKCRALVEDVCLDGSVNVSIRGVSEQGHSPDAACTIAVGSEAAVAPQHVRVWAVTPVSACVRWHPSNSNAEHIVSLNAIKVGVCPPSVFQVQLQGLCPSTIYRVSVRTKHPKAVLEQRPVERCLDFKTLPKIGLPDPPLNVCCEAGPQPGTLLVSWTPVQSQPKPPSRAAVHAYLVYADGKNIAQVPSASADHVLLRLADLSDDPPIFITVRTKTREGAVSGDSNVARVPRGAQLQSALGSAPASLVDPLRGAPLQNDLLKLQDTIDAPMAASYPSASYPVFQHQSSLPTQLPVQLPVFPTGTLPRQQAPYSAPISLQASMMGPPLPIQSSVPFQQQQQTAINPFTASLLQGYPSVATGGERVLPLAASGVSPASQWKTAAMSQYYTFHPRLMRNDHTQEDTRPSVMEMENNYLLRHRQSDWTNGAPPSDIRARLAAYVGRTAPEPRPHRLVPPRLARVKSESGFGTRSEPDLRPPPLEDDCRWFVALFDYDHHMSPNANAESEELSFRKHQLIKVYGEVDADGFYHGQIGSRAGLVPSNMVIEIAKDDLLPRRSSPAARDAVPSGAEPALRRMRWGSLKSRSYDHAGDRRPTYGRAEPAHHYSSLDRRDHSLPPRERYRRPSARVEYGAEYDRYGTDRYREGSRERRDEWREQRETRDSRERDERYREDMEREDYRDKYRERDERCYERRGEERYGEERREQREHRRQDTLHNGYRDEREYRHRRDELRPGPSEDRSFYGGEATTGTYGQGPRYSETNGPSSSSTHHQMQPIQQLGSMPNHMPQMGQSLVGSMTQMGGSAGVPMGGQMGGTPLHSQMAPTHPPPLTSQGSATQLTAHLQQMNIGGAMQLPIMEQRLNGASMKKMVAKFDYDSRQLSPNVDAEQVELSFRQGDIITVFGEMDEDGFYMGELNGQRGLVPSNFLQGSPISTLAPSQPPEPMQMMKKGVAFSDAAAAMQKKSLPGRQTSQTTPAATVMAGSAGTAKPAAKKSTSSAAGAKPLAKKASDVGKGGAPARKTSAAVKKDAPKKK